MNNIEAQTILRNTIDKLENLNATNTEHVMSVYNEYLREQIQGGNEATRFLMDQVDRNYFAKLHAATETKQQPAAPQPEETK